MKKSHLSINIISAMLLTTAVELKGEMDFEGMCLSLVNSQY